MEHKAVKKKWDTLVFVCFIVNVGKLSRVQLTQTLPIVCFSKFMLTKLPLKA